jgi:16S rRNA G527 N7-methylase RsmG
MHEAYDLLTVRAVRMEAKLLATLQAFVKPGGHMFLFQGAAQERSDSFNPLLTRKAVHPLIEALGSRLLVLEKR